MNELKEYKGYKIKIEQDIDSMNPRTEFDNLGTLVCFHRRYDLGDRNHGWHSSEDFLRWLNEQEAQPRFKKGHKIVALPVYMYEHSGITLNTTGFNCPWDSGQVGVIYVTADKIKKEFGWKQLTPKRVEKIKKLLRDEIKTYDQFVTGDVYGCEVLNPEGEFIDSCWGFYGSDPAKSGLEEFAHTTIDAEYQRRLKDEGMQMTLNLEV